MFEIKLIGFVFKTSCNRNFLYSIKIEYFSNRPNFRHSLLLGTFQRAPPGTWHHTRIALEEYSTHSQRAHTKASTSKVGNQTRDDVDVSERDATSPCS